MSLGRLVYYSAVIGGFGAFLGWLISELLFFAPLRYGSVGFTGVTIIGGLIGAAIGAAINLVGGAANAQWKSLLRRGIAGLVCGGVGGAVGGLAGNTLFVFAGMPRSIGWLFMGLGIGVAEGVYERSKRKARNGLIGGALGGLAAGLLFDFVPWLVGQLSGLTSASGMSSRATAFVVTGVSIGALVGLAQVVLREAWLTVLDGYKAGRHLLLTQDVTKLGRGDHLPLPFLGPMNQHLESEHLSITRQPQGAYLLENHSSRLGTRVNNRPVTGPVPLSDGDVIRLGSNLVRFNERQRKATESPFVEQQPVAAPVPPPPPPPDAAKSPLKPPPLPTSVPPISSSAPPAAPKPSSEKHPPAPPPPRKWR